MLKHMLSKSCKKAPKVAPIFTSFVRKKNALENTLS